MCEKLLCSVCFNQQRDNSTPLARCGTCHVDSGAQQRMHRLACAYFAAWIALMVALTLTFVELADPDPTVLGVLIFVMVACVIVLVATCVPYMREKQTGIARD